MRPIIFAALLAIGIHGLLLGMEFDCLKKKYVRRPETRAITMTLTYFVPPHPNPLPRGGEGRVRGRRPQVIEKLPKAQKRPVISKKMVSAPAKPDKVIFEESEPSEEIVYQNPDSTYQKADQKADIDVAAAVDIEKETPVMIKAVPLYKVNPPPEYPRLARKRGYQGTVVLEVLVDQNGRVGDLRLFTSSGHSILDRKAMASVKEWLFEPGIKGDKKLDMWVRVPVRFELK
ncbi:MAG: energy transducer TonB [Thermodesulfobacteriota bacterium]|nr:energy transducer TonB [Thermodesulfobacteriota bacterium]